MKTLFILAIFATLVLNAEPKGSVHDAWSDWILGQKDKTEVEEQIVDNSEQDLSDDSSEE